MGVQLITFLLIGVGLSVDSFAVSVSCGMLKQEIRFRQAVPIAASMAFFQTLFPLLGWYAGTSLHHLIQGLSHWIAFILLALIGIKMIMDGTRANGPLQNAGPIGIKIILGLSIATSIDALIVGLSFGFLEMPVLIPVIIIGSVTFLVSMLGMLFGKWIPVRRSWQSLIFGGIILTAIGFKILVNHLLYL
jgi:manganese efflux pump family protein